MMFGCVGERWCGMRSLRYIMVAGESAFCLVGKID